MNQKKIIIFSIRLIFAIVFLYTGLAKVLNHWEFSSQLKGISFLKPLAGWLAWIVPSLELLIPFALAIKRLYLNGLYACFILMLLFTIYIITLNRISYDIPCSCGGLLEQLPSDVHIFLNLTLAGIALVGIVLENNIFKKFRHLY